MLSKKKNIKSARLIARQRKKLVGSVIFSIICVLSFWGLAYYCFNSPLINISSVKISGLKTISEDEILKITSSILDGKYFYTIPKSNILVYSQDLLVSSIENQFAEIEDVSVTRTSLHSIELVVKERSPESIFCQKEFVATDESIKKEVCYFVDTTGLIYQKVTVASSTPEYLRLSTYHELPKPVGTMYAGGEFYTSLIDFVSNLKLIDYKVTSIYERGDWAYELILSTKQKLIVGPSDDLSVVLNNFQTVMSHASFKDVGGFASVDYLDLRFGNKVYYRGR